MKNKDIYIDRSIILEDDNTEHGGVAFAGETLGDFLDEAGCEFSTLEELNTALKECGIKPLTTKQALFGDIQLLKHLDDLERQTTALLDIVTDNASRDELERYYDIAKTLLNNYSPTARNHSDKDIRFEIYNILGTIYSYFAETLED